MPQTIMPTMSPRFSNTSAMSREPFIDSNDDLIKHKERVQEALHEQYKEKSKDKSDNGPACCGNDYWCDMLAFQTNPGRVVYKHDGETLGQDWAYDTATQKVELGPVQVIDTPYMSVGEMDSANKDGDGDDEDASEAKETKSKAKPVGKSEAKSGQGSSPGSKKRSYDDY